jgi:hypothetical protein
MEIMNKGLKPSPLSRLLNLDYLDSALRLLQLLRLRSGQDAQAKLGTSKFAVVERSQNTAPLLPCGINCKLGAERLIRAFLN